MLNIGHSLILTLGCLSVLSTSIAQAELIASNDLSELDTDSKTFRVDGDDPYFVFRAQGEGELAQYLLFDVSTSAASRSFQLFFQQSDGLFDPWQRLDFNHEQNSSQFAIKLPKTVTIKAGQALRLDIDECAKCDLKIGSSPRLSVTDQGFPLATVRQVYDGLKTLADEGQGIPLTNNAWRLNSIEGSLQQFKIASNDPHLVSPNLTINTQDLAGVYFKIAVPDNANVSNDFQLYYATESHAFIERATSIIRVENNSTGESEIALLFPLGFLSKELPASKVLQRVRLDLPLISGDWSLSEAKLVSTAQRESVATPGQLVQIKRQRPSARTLIKSSVLNVFADIGFILSYLTLLMIVTYGFVRAYKK